MEVMLENRVIPIVNENDTISVTELMFTDNDELSGLIATMMDMDALIILSNIDGIYNGNPADSSSTVIREIRGSKNDLSDYVQTSKSSFGRGGMLTKCNIAQKVADEGIQVIIANGKKEIIADDMFVNEDYIQNYKEPFVLISNDNMLVDSLNINKEEIKYVDNVHALEPNYLRES
jgi:glutamate 5-kinase